MEDCKCLLTVESAKGLAKLLREKASELTGPLVGVPRDAGLEEAQILVDIAKDVYMEAAKFTQDKRPPLRGSRFLSEGQAGTVRWTLEHFDKIAEEAKPAAVRNEPLLATAGSLNGLADGFDDIADRLAITCVQDKKLFH